MILSIKSFFHSKRNISCKVSIFFEDRPRVFLQPIHAKQFQWRHSRGATAKSMEVHWSVHMWWLAQWRYSRFSSLWRDCWTTRVTCTCFYEPAHTRRQMPHFHGNVTPHWLGWGETMANERGTPAGAPRGDAAVLPFLVRTYYVWYFWVYKVRLSLDHVK